MSKHHKETLNFTGSGYYGALSTEDGYGGFNYGNDMGYINATYWENIVSNWCDNGYTNVTAASKGAVGCAYVYVDGVMESANLSESFSLTSMIAASAWDTDAVWNVKSYTYANGALTLKASDTMTISQTAAKIDFGKLGQKDDFRNISAVTFQLENEGGAGSTCRDGGGDQFCLDALKVKWNGKIPSGGGTHKLVLPPGLASHHHLTPHPWAQQLHAPNHADAGAAAHAATHHSDVGYHSQLLSLDMQRADGLTDRFHLPQLEHFGT